ncbi:hypothetical protein [Mesomycoplasma ovipneumoniae]|uniref:hypothetical protein n=1 Tax=Mesomycoplasma ovipneumoniae TaxID=29562 RepID=UPI000693D505|nr:hypothetical protein [Mesomycoplasma ovipneumoniae]
MIVSCTDPDQESPKNISKSPTPGQGNNNPVEENNNPKNTNPEKTNPEKGSPILEDNSDIITNSVLGFNGQKKNPKVAKNRFDVTKNYTEEIIDAHFLSDTPGGTGKYGLLPYWYYLQSIPKYLEKNNYIINNKYNKEEYLKRLEYFYTKIRDYRNRNLIEYTSSTASGKGEVEVWKQGLRNQYREFLKPKDGEKDGGLNIPLPDDLKDDDKVDPRNKFALDNYFSIIKPELDKSNAQIPNDTRIKRGVVFDFLLANERIWPSVVDNVIYGAYKALDQARLFRDDYYIEKGYKPSELEKLWYEQGWFMLRPQRIISSANASRSVLEDIYYIEKYLFDLPDQNKNIDEPFSPVADSIYDFINSLANFLTPEHHLSLRKDLVFNIDISNNTDDQSLISDFIEYYNQKIVPIIWRLNLKQNDDRHKIKPLTKKIKDFKDDRKASYFNTYLKPLLPKIKDLPDEEDIKNNQTLSDETKEQARQEARKAGIKAWGIWLKNYQEKYGINFKPDPEIDQEYFDYSSSLSSVAKPEPTENTSPSNTIENTQQISEQTEVIQEDSEPQSEPVENTSPSNTQQPNNIQQKTEQIEETQEAVGPQS